jgi:phosphohistidine phosphatase
VDAILQDHQGRSVVLVGHQPTMGVAAALLLGMASFPRPVVPGTVIGIEVFADNPAGGRLLFYAAPGQAVSVG